MGRVLLIGNDPALAGALRTSHQLSAHEVETCAGPLEAARLVGARGVDVVVTDPVTPASEDVALLTHLRQIWPGLRSLVLAPALSNIDVITALREQVYA